MLHLSSLGSASSNLATAFLCVGIGYGCRREFKDEKLRKIKCIRRVGCEMRLRD